LERQAERQTVEAARRGDAEAFGRLYREYYAAMVWLAYSILLDRNLAEDAAQQAFVKACERLADLRRTERFGAWLAQICRNEAHQLLRDNRRSTAQPSRESACADERETNRADLDVVKKAVGQLPPMYREIVVLHYYNHMDYRQIAATLGITGHTVRGRLFRARRQIERTLRDNGFGER
jgi:RNA polymerase sigma-70 factor (ECF subfamily)